MILTKKLLEDVATRGIGFNGLQLSILRNLDPLNEKGPAKKGWKKRVVGKYIDDSVYSKLLSLKGASSLNFRLSKETQIKYKKELESKATLAELKFKKFLDFYKIQYKFQQIVKRYPDVFFADFYLLSPYRLYVEIDGKYHERDEQIVYDSFREKRMSRKGKFVIRFTNEFVLTSCYAELYEEFIKKFKEGLYNKFPQEF